MVEVFGREMIFVRFLIYKDACIVLKKFYFIEIRDKPERCESDDDAYNQKYCDSSNRPTI